MKRLSSRRMTTQPVKVRVRKGKVREFYHNTPGKAVIAANKFIGKKNGLYGGWFLVTDGPYFAFAVEVDRED